MYAYAFNTIKFLDAVDNVRKIAGGAIADFRYKDAAGRGYSTLNRAVTSRELAPIARKRILCVSGGVGTLLMCGIGVSLLIDYLEDDGWTIDVPNNTIYKDRVKDFDGIVFSSISDTCLFDSLTPVYQCFVGSNSSAGVVSYRLKNVDLTSFFNAIQNLQVGASTISPPYVELLKTNPTTGQATVVHTTSQVKAKRVRTGGEISRTEITDAEIADAIDRTGGDPDLLRTDPEMQTEPDHPAVKAAADAKPDDEGQSCPAGKKWDATKKDCVTEKAVSETKEDGTTETEFPTFCVWASAVCDFIDWAKEEPPAPPNDTSTVEVQEKQITKDPSSFDQNYLNYGGQCPSSQSKEIRVGTTSFALSFDITPLCDLAIAVRPAILGLAYFVALGIVSNAIREV